MRKSRTKFLFAFLIASARLAAQTNSVDQKMADGLRENGMLNVVLICLGIVLAGLLITVWRLDRKVSRLEIIQKESKA
jgi:hypothetical protein